MPPKDEQSKGYLNGKEKDDCDRYVREVVQAFLEARSFTQKDEQAVRAAVREMFELQLQHHISTCAKERGKVGHSTFTIIISAISMLISLGVFTIMMWKLFSSMNP